MSETPTINSARMKANAYTGTASGWVAEGATALPTGTVDSQIYVDSGTANLGNIDFGRYGEAQLRKALEKSGIEQIEQGEDENVTRLVRVIIIDPNDSLALTDRIIHNGGEQLTDATDQELFFEVPIMELLKTHNERRTKTRDKNKSKKEEVMLEEARIRDLVMNVVEIASF